MKYFYDTEFLEDGKTIDLISIGIVAEDGRKYYAVSQEFDTRRVAQNQWLMDNVMRSIEYIWINDPTGPNANFALIDGSARTRAQIATDIERFLDDDAELWAWYSAYDHVALAQLWGKMIDLPNNVPMFTNDIRTLVRLAGNSRIPAQPAGEHNALEDARFNVVRYNYLMEILHG